MTGAGSLTASFVPEQSYLGGISDTPEYRLPGTDIEFSDASLDNQLERLADPGDVTAQTHLAQNIEGAFSASWVLSGTSQFHLLTFNNDSDGDGTVDSLVSGTFPSSEWYLGLDYLSGVAERVLKGVVFTEVSWEYEQGSPVRVSATGVYGDEALNTSVSTGSLTKPSNEMPGHAAELTIDGMVQLKLSSATLTLSNLARLQRGASRQPLEAVVGPADIKLTVDSIYTETDQTQLAYGSGGATAPQDLVGGVPGSFTFTDDAGNTVADYSLSGLTPANYAWNNIPPLDDNAEESITFQATDITASS